MDCNPGCNPVFPVRRPPADQSSSPEDLTELSNFDLLGRFERACISIRGGDMEPLRQEILRRMIRTCAP